MTFSSKKTVVALDFGPATVTTCVAAGRKDGGFSVVGSGSAPAEGVKCGRIENLGDAVEAVVASVRQAGQSAGVKIEALHAAFRDPELRTVRAQGSKCLSGEGEIQLSDVEESLEAAERAVRHFDWNFVYSREVSFVIDGRDAVDEAPVGVFGRNLELTALVVMAKAQPWEAWAKLMRRAGLEKTTWVLSTLADVYAVLPPEARRPKSIVFHLDRQLVTAAVYGHDRLLDHRVGAAGQTLLEMATEFIHREGGIEKVWVTGEGAETEKNWHALKSGLSIPVSLAAPHGVPALAKPEFSTLVGLLHAAAEGERRSLHERPSALLGGLKEKAVSFLNEYF